MYFMLSRFSLLKSGYVAVLEHDLSDSVILPSDSLDVLMEYLWVIPLHGTNHLRVLGKIRSHCGITYKGDCRYDNIVIARGVDVLDIREVTLIQGYYLLIVSFHQEDYIGLLVVGMEDYRFVGFISSYYGTVSSAELSRLVLVTPEIDWAV